MRKTSDADNFHAATVTGGIEEQEARGQQELTTAGELPKQMGNGCTREKLEAMGIVFGEDVDELFVKVTLPDGWKVKPTDHSMWCELVNEKGEKQAGIFYKAAFYDRRAHISISQ